MWPTTLRKPGVRQLWVGAWEVAVYGADPPTLRDLKGHSDISVTSRYLAATPHRREAVAVLAGLPGPGGVE